MQAYQLTWICLRILSIIFIFQGITALPEVSLLWHDYALGLFLSSWAVLFALVKLLPLIAGGMFWWRTQWLTELVVNTHLRQSKGLKVSVHQLLSVGMLVVGTMVCLRSLPDLAGHGLTLLLDHREAMGEDIGSLFLVNTIVSAVEALLGMILIVVAPVLARWMAVWWPSKA